MRCCRDVAVENQKEQTHEEDVIHRHQAREWRQEEREGRESTLPALREPYSPTERNRRQGKYPSCFEGTVHLLPKVRGDEAVKARCSADRVLYRVGPTSSASEE